MPPANQTRSQDGDQQGNEPQSRDVPRYKLTEAAYLRTEEDRFERMCQAGEEIEFRGLPGYHMEPLNAAAKAMVAKHKPEQLDFNRMTPLRAA